VGGRLHVPTALSPGERAPDSVSIGGWVGPIATDNGWNEISTERVFFKYHFNWILILLLLTWTEVAEYHIYCESIWKSCNESCEVKRWWTAMLYASRTSDRFDLPRNHPGQLPVQPPLERVCLYFRILRHCEIRFCLLNAAFSLPYVDNIYDPFSFAYAVSTNL
jgi:hypothetical protein